VSRLPNLPITVSRRPSSVHLRRLSSPGREFLAYSFEQQAGQRIARLVTNFVVGEPERSHRLGHLVADARS
jgi:hypothetical protein